MKLKEVIYFIKELFIIILIGIALAILIPISFAINTIKRKKYEEEKLDPVKNQ